MYDAPSPIRPSRNDQTQREYLFRLAEHTMKAIAEDPTDEEDPAQSLELAGLCHVPTWWPHHHPPASPTPLPPPARRLWFYQSLLGELNPRLNEFVTSSDSERKQLVVECLRLMMEADRESLPTPA